MTAGCTAFTATTADVTVENTASAEYQLTVYVFAEPVGAGNVTYRVTNSTDGWTTASNSQLRARTSISHSPAMDCHETRTPRSAG